MLTISLISSACVREQQSPARLEAPYAVTPIYDIAPASGAASRPFSPVYGCSPAPTPAVDLSFESIYEKSSKNASIVDPEAHGNYISAMKPLNSFESGLASMGNRYLRSGGSHPEVAACVLDWLTAWADADAMTGYANRQGEFVRGWVLASVANAWLQVRDEPSLDEQDKKHVESWMAHVARLVQSDFRAGDHRSSRYNNHLYWSAWSVMATGIATDNPALYDWGLRRARVGVRAIRTDGTLPLELARGRKALNYHTYAATPLFMMAETAAKNGTDLYAENDQALYRLARRILHGIEDPDWFKRKTGEKQDLTRTVTSANLVWLEPYFKRTQDPEALKLLHQYRPMKQSRVGGDATLLFNR